MINNCSLYFFYHNINEMENKIYFKIKLIFGDACFSMCGNCFNSCAFKYYIIYSPIQQFHFYYLSTFCILHQVFSSALLIHLLTSFFVCELLQVIFITDHQAHSYLYGHIIDNYSHLCYIINIHLLNVGHLQYLTQQVHFIILHTFYNSLTCLILYIPY